jgi:hypothetical protein
MRANIEQAGKMCVIVGHVGLHIMQKARHNGRAVRWIEGE